MDKQPATLSEFVQEIREGLTCDRCGKYVGTLAKRRYLPPRYPVALDRFSPEEEVEALVGFEWHMLGLVRQGNFVIRHAQKDGRCLSYREWADSRGEDVEHEQP